MGTKISGGYRVAATLNPKMKERIREYGQKHDMKESEIVKEGIRILLKTESESPSSY